MKIVIVTSQRDPSYLDATLESLFASDDSIAKVYVLVHELSLDCLGKWREDARVLPRRLSESEHAEKMRLGKRTRVCHAERLALEAVGDDEAIVCEDDCTFQLDWFKRFVAELDAYQFGTGPFATTRAHAMISVCHHLKEDHLGILPWNPKSYWGTVAMFYGKIARLRAVEAFVTFEAGRHPGHGQGSDVALQRMLLQSNYVRLYARHPSLVTHVGEVSSIGSLTPEGSKHRRDRRPRKPHAPVTWPEKVAHPVQPTASGLRPPPGVTTKERKNPNPPTTWPRKA